MNTLYIINDKAYKTSQAIDTVSELSIHDTKSYIYSRSNDNLGTNPRIKYISKEDQLIDVLVNVDRIIFFSTKQPVLPIKYLNAMFSCGCKSLFWIDDKGETNQFVRDNDGDRLLFIFPGSILPLTLGSHQRSFNLLNNLADAGYSIDVLIPKPKNSELSNLLKYSLGTVCHRLFFYENNYLMFPKPYRMFRKLEEKWRLLQNKQKRLPDLFFERDYRRPTVSCQKMVNSLYLEYRYSTIIVSYAWMMRSIKYIEHFKDVSIVCDTHDVQYMRSSDFLNKRERLSYFRFLEKKFEYKRLQKADLVLAISRSDQQTLTNFLNKENKVITTSSGFDYALKRVKKRPKDRPIIFGFIGGGMEANVLAVEYILEQWWPKIRQFSPDSEFLIAGSIGKNSRILKKSLLDDSIKILGFVDNLDSFYHQIEVSLNPVMVQGGLNFKSVEAVFQGKHLLTNRMGIECLGKNFQCTIIDNPEDIEVFLKNYEFDLEKDYRFRLNAQNKAKEAFTNKKVMIDFLAAHNHNLN